MALRLHPVAGAALFLTLGALIPLAFRFVDTPKAPAAAPESRNLAAEVDSLRSDLSRVRKTAQQSAHAVARAAENAPATPDGAGVSQQAIAQDDEPAPTSAGGDPFDAWEGQWKSEPVDRTWALRTEDQLRNVVKDLAPDSTVREAKCASTMCRIEVEHKTAENHYQLLSSTVGVAPFSNGGTAKRVSDGNGPPRTIIFVAREARAL
jgi:hypothetical protein